MEMYLKLYNVRKNYTWIKKFLCESDMDKFIHKLKYVIDVSILEDSRDIYYPDYNVEGGE